MKSVLSLLIWIIAIGVANGKGTVETLTLHAPSLTDTKLDINPTRTVKVYLPEGYEGSQTRYPVIYFLHSIIFDNADNMFEKNAIAARLDFAIENGVIPPVMFVLADYSTPFVGSFYQNNPVSGRWLDFTARDLVTHIDSHYRTLADAGSRGVAGHFMGARGALALGMKHPDVFSTVYGMHPVATDTGYFPMTTRPDWRKMNLASRDSDLDGDIFARVFMAMSQAFLPNPDKPPFYTDLMVELNEGELEIRPERVKSLHRGFLLDEWVPDHVEALNSLKAIKFDWGRYDPNLDHVRSNQAFTRLLDEYGIAHEAEEFTGDHYSLYWTEDGRVMTDVLPFFKRHLSFKGQY